MKCDAILTNTFEIIKRNYQPFSFQVSLERIISKTNYSRSTERKEGSKRSNSVGRLFSEENYFKMTSQPKSRIKIGVKYIFKTSFLELEPKFGLKDIFKILKLYQMTKSQSVFHLDVRKCDAEFLKFVIDSFNINAKDTSHKTPLSFSLLDRNKSKIKILVQKSENFCEEDRNDSNLDAAINDDAEMFELLINKKDYLNMKNANGLTLLHYAAAKKL